MARGDLALSNARKVDELGLGHVDCLAENSSIQEAPRRGSRSSLDDLELLIAPAFLPNVLEEKSSAVAATGQPANRSGRITRIRQGTNAWPRIQRVQVNAGFFVS
jgi:hypothetical protein